MNTMQVAQLDYSAMHPNLLYTWEKKQAPNNLYQMVIDELTANGHQCDKFIVKKVILTSINADSRQDLARAINKDKKDELKANVTRIKEGRMARAILYDELAKYKLDKYTIIDAFQKVHPDLAKYVYSCSSNKS